MFSEDFSAQQEALAESVFECKHINGVRAKAMVCVKDTKGAHVDKERKGKNRTAATANMWIEQSK